jgi:hypothetical protein
LNHFFNENKIKLKFVLEFGGILGVCWKVFDELDLIEFISQFSKLRCGRYFFLKGFLKKKFNQITKIGFGRKKSVELSMCSHLGQWHKIH